MNSRTKPLIFIVLGAIGLCGAIIVAKKRQNADDPPGTGGKAAAKVKVLIATQDLRYGETIIPAGRENKDKKEKLNARFIEWPKPLVPRGAVTDPPTKVKPKKPDEKTSAEQAKKDAEKANKKAAQLLDRLKAKKVRARTPILANSPVFATHVAAKLRPKGSRLCAVGALREHIMQGLFSEPDTQVDLKKKSRSGRYDQLWMEGVPVFGLGKLTDKNDVVACESDKQKLWILLPNAEMEDMFRQESKSLRALPRIGPPLPAPVLPGKSSPINESEARRAIDQMRARQKMLGNAEGAADKGRFADACKALAECEEVKLLLSARQSLFDAILKRADAASKAKDYDAALAALREFDAASEVFVRAVAMRKRLEALASAEARQNEYASLLQATPVALESGNLPLVEKQLARIQLFALERFLPDNAEHRKPATAHADFSKLLTTRRQDFQKDVAHFDKMIERGVLEVARKTLATIRKKFPEHPDIKGKLEPRLRKAEGG